MILTNRNVGSFRFGFLAVALVIAGIAGVFLWPLLSGTGSSSREQIASPESRNAARGKVIELRELSQRFPGDLETRYWLAAAIIESAKSNQELLEAGTIFESIPENSTPNWLPEWKRKRLAQLSLELFARQRLSATEEPFQSGLIAQFEKVVCKQRFITAEKVREDLQQLRDLLLKRWAYAEEKRVQTGKNIDEAYENCLAEIRPEMRPADAVQLDASSERSPINGAIHRRYVGRSLLRL
jgi:hypothetical protein